MKKRAVFCEECRDYVAYTVAEKHMCGKIKEQEYHYIGKEARCADCDSLVYVPDIVDENLKALYDVYRKENGIISLDTILAIPEKYSIGKRPLSLMLGWGEQTFSQYCYGDVPSKQYSDILLKIYNDPAYYAELLENGKDRLKSDVAYRKTKKAVDDLLSINSDSDSKLNIAIKYLLNQCEDITSLALQKALYYIQGFYYAFNHTYIFSEDCEAWVHGPVYKNVYLKYKDYSFNPIKQSEPFDESILNTSEKAIYDSVINNLCCYSAKTLERFTHIETPWIRTRGNLSVLEHSNRIIPKEFIGDYFLSVKEKYNMINPNDIGIYAKEMFACI